VRVSIRLCVDLCACALRLRVLIRVCPLCIPATLCTCTCAPVLCVSTPNKNLIRLYVRIFSTPACMCNVHARLLPHLTRLHITHTHKHTHIHKHTHTPAEQCAPYMLTLVCVFYQVVPKSARTAPQQQAMATNKNWIVERAKAVMRMRVAAARERIEARKKGEHRCDCGQLCTLTVARTHTHTHT